MRGTERHGHPQTNYWINVEAFAGAWSFLCYADKLDYITSNWTAPKRVRRYLIAVKAPVLAQGN